MWHNGGMDPAVARAARAVAALRRAEARTEQARAEAHAALRDALRGAPRGRQAELMRATGYSRERLRQIAREAS